jgi:hypothetical protein
VVEAAVFHEVAFREVVFHEVVFPVKALLRLVALRRTRGPYLVMQEAWSRAREQPKPAAWDKPSGWRKPTDSSKPTGWSRLLNSTTGLIPMRERLRLGTRAQRA